MKRVSFLLLLTISCLSLLGNNHSYDIKVSLRGSNDKSLLLVSYYGESFQLIDTAEIINGSFRFQGNKKLEPGVYAIANNKKTKYFDFLIENDFEFQIITNVKSLIDSATIMNSEENSIFFDYLKQSSKLFYINKKIQKNKNNPNRFSELSKFRNNIQKDLNILKSGIHKDYSSSILSLVLNAMKDSPVLKETVENNKRYNHFKNHYWDYIDLSDRRILRTPIFFRKFNNYFDKILLQHPDTLIKEIDNFYSNHKINSEVKKYLSWSLLMKYEYPKIMGFDKMFVHLAEQYYSKGKIENVSSAVLKHIENRSKVIKSVLIGSNAPNLLLVDTTGNYIDLYNRIKKDYTIIFFWDFDCKICQKEIKELNKLYKSGFYNWDIYAVCTVGKIEKWKTYVRKSNLNWIHVNGTRSAGGDYHDIYDIYSTPTIYVLNKEMKIIAKRIGTDRLKDFLKNYELLLSND